jgi:hypothetical protein
MQKRALFLRRIGCPWWTVHVVITFNRLYPNRALDASLQRFVARSLHAEA